MQPIAVTAHLAASPVSVTGPLNLEALLVAGWYETHQPAPADALWRPPLPVACPEVGGLAVAVCADASPADPHWRRGTSMVHRRRGRDSTLTRVPLICTASLGWTAVGDGDGVQALLRRVRRVGRLRAHGYGRIRSWTVAPADQPPEHVLVGADGRARRAIPVEWVAEASEVLPQAWRPPYWHAASLHPCVPAGAACRLRPEVVAAVRALCAP